MLGRNRRTRVGRPRGSCDLSSRALDVPPWHDVKKRVAPPLGRAIQGERESRGVSAEELAGRLGICTGTVMKWERGDACPTVTDLVRVAWSLAAPVSRLLEDVEDV